MRFLLRSWLRQGSCARLIESVRPYPIATATITSTATESDIILVNRRKYLSWFLECFWLVIWIYFFFLTLAKRDWKNPKVDRLLDLGGFQGTRNIACDSSSFQIGTSKLTHGSFSRELSKQDFLEEKNLMRFYQLVNSKCLSQHPLQCWRVSPCAFCCVCVIISFQSSPARGCIDHDPYIDPAAEGVHK